MKRLILCALAALLTSGALVSVPAYACTTDPQCSGNEECTASCISRGYRTGTCNWCTGRCVCAR